jgi:hypothetical protein
MRANPESIFLDDRHMDSGFAGVAGEPGMTSVFY